MILAVDQRLPFGTLYVCFGPKSVSMHGMMRYFPEAQRLAITSCVLPHTHIDIGRRHISRSNQLNFRMTRNVWIYSFSGWLEAIVLPKLPFYSALHYQCT